MDPLHPFDPSTKKKMENEFLSAWNEVVFELKPYPSSRLHILVQHSQEEIGALVTDERRKIQAEENPATVLRREEAVNVLNLVESIVDEWMAVQSRWIHCQYFLATDKMKRRVGKVGADFILAEEHFGKIIRKCLENPKILPFCLASGLLNELKQLNQEFEAVGSLCVDHREKIRTAFPRFFFVSDDELIQILTVSDVKQLKPFLGRLFTAVNDLKWDAKLNAVGMTSHDSEYVPWPKPVAWSNSNIFIESWLSNIEDVMYQAVWDHVMKARRTYPESDRTLWALYWPCMAVLCVSQIYWASEAAQAISDERGKGLIEFNNKCNRQLEEIIVMLRGSLSDLQRRSIGGLIITEVHARDLSRQLVEDSVSSVTDFAWLAQLRYSWEENNVYCSLLFARRKYGYEYSGVESRLVATPLTDRCHRTLICALHSSQSGSLEGPAGTGKSETVKDLARAFALNCIHINCSDGIDFLLMAKIFRGVLCCGNWICLDEFNRLDIEVLTIVAQQILCIQSALKCQSAEIHFEGSHLKLNPACAIFVTINPVDCCVAFWGT